MLRIDDIPQQVADDIHAFGVIGYKSVEIFTDLWYNEAKKGGEQMQYYELSSKKLHFIVTPDELRSILKDFHHVVMNTGVRKNYTESNPNDFLFTYDALYEKLNIFLQA